jgi:hypothetical protein
MDQIVVPSPRALSSSQRIVLPPAAPPASREGGAPQGWGRFLFVRPDGRVEATPWSDRLIVASFSLLLAQLVMGNGLGTGPNSSYVGASYMALGTGQASWDTSGPPAPTTSQTQLVNEPATGNFRKPVQAQMVDASGNVTTTPTNRVLVSAVFNVGEANGQLRELGLFGGNATLAPNSGLLIDYETFPVVNKPSGTNDYMLVRQIVLIF